MNQKVKQQRVFMACTHTKTVEIRVFTEVTFWNSAEYGILCGSDFTLREIFHCLIPRNFVVIPRIRIRPKMSIFDRIRIRNNLVKIMLLGNTYFHKLLKYGLKPAFCLKDQLVIR
jgi:hypothetical protein